MIHSWLGFLDILGAHLKHRNTMFHINTVSKEFGSNKRFEQSF